MNILIPMAGRGERFSSAGFTVPKPYIDVNGEPMIGAAIRTLGLKGRYIFITRDYDLPEGVRKKIPFELKDYLASITKDPIIININYTTRGPASSALLAKDLINTDEPLLITNCDQIMKWDAADFTEKIIHGNNDGALVVYTSSTPKNSYVTLKTIKGGKEWVAAEVAEKKVISEYSLNGIHFWRRGEDFVKSAEKMIFQNKTVNNEFYISETYNELIRKGKKIKVYHLKEGQHWPVGVPEDLGRYLASN